MPDVNERSAWEQTVVDILSDTITELTLPSNLSGCDAIDTSILNGFPALEKLIIDASTYTNKYIPADFMRDNTVIQEVDIVGGITNMGDSAFQDCTNLRKVILPDTLVSLPPAFVDGCLSLESIHFKSTQPPMCSVEVFSYDLPKTCIIYVPKGSLAAYTSADNYPDPNTYTYVEEELGL